MASAGSLKLRFRVLLRLVDEHGEPVHEPDRDLDVGIVTVPLSVSTTPTGPIMRSPGYTDRSTSD